MSSWWKDLKNSIVGGISLRPAARTSTGNGSGVDLLTGDGGSCAIIQAGTITDGTHTVTVEESNDNSTYTAVSGADSKALAAADSDTVTLLNFTRTKRYVRAVTTVAGATTGGLYGVAVHAMKKAG